MKSIKVFGLAMVAAIVAMAFVGASSAMAIGPEVVVCGENPASELCPSAKVLSQGATLTGLAEDPILLGTLDEECEHSVVSGKITSAGGMGTSLLGSIDTVSFTGNCSPCDTVTATATELHVTRTGANAYLVKVLNPLALFTDCPLNAHCAFKAPGGTNEIHMTATNIASGTLILANKVPLSRYQGGFFCGATGEWDADYIVKDHWLATFKL